MLERLRQRDPDDADQVRKRLADLTGTPVPPPDAPTTEGKLVERWLPGGLRAGHRKPMVVVLVAVAALAAVVVAVGVWSHRPAVEQPSVVSHSVARGTEPAKSAQLIVSVIGKVVHPGLVTLPEGARVADALRAAGGPAPDADLSGVNLARKLSDGEQLPIGVPGAVAAQPQDQPPDKVDLNTATEAQLRQLPGVGPTTCKRILQWRGKHGRFDSVDQLREVEGIGNAKFAKLKDLVRT